MSELRKIMWRKYSW